MRARLGGWRRGLTSVLPVAAPPRARVAVRLRCEWCSRTPGVSMPPLMGEVAVAAGELITDALDDDTWRYGRRSGDDPGQRTHAARPGEGQIPGGAPPADSGPTR